MGLLDGGISALFGAAFGGLYLDGMLIAGLSGPIYDAGGTIIGYSGTGDTPIKFQRDATTYAMQQSDSYVEGDARFIVLANAIPAITTDHRIADNDGKTWLIQSADLDAASSHWQCRARAA